MNNKNGFTLIELLVVIAIIGILSTVILTSLSQSQAKAYDSKIKQQLNGFRTAAQMYFTNHGGYDPATNDCSQGMFNDVDTQNGSPGLYIASGNLPASTQVFCGSSLKAYALKATLYSGSGYWCVDNTGFSGMFSGTPSSGTICQ
jgi:prepilin-type N-terminal cleavage/methylation domain-containing protein